MEPMVGQKNRPASSKIELSTGGLVALLFAMGLGFGLIGFGLSTLGRSLIGGDIGEWAGMTAAFAVLCMTCWIMIRTMSHRHLATVCAIWVCMAASKVGEEIGTDIGGDFAPKWGGSIAFLAVFVILISVANAIGRREEASDAS